MAIFTCPVKNRDLMWNKVSDSLREKNVHHSNNANTNDSDDDLNSGIHEILSYDDFNQVCGHKNFPCCAVVEVMSANCPICSHTEIILEDLPRQFPEVKFYRMDMEMIPHEELSKIAKQIGIPETLDLPYFMFFNTKGKQIAIHAGLPSKKRNLFKSYKLAKIRARACTCCKRNATYAKTSLSFILQFVFNYTKSHKH